MNKKKIILSLSSVLLLLVIYSLFFGAQTVCVLGVRRFLKEPIVNVVPTPMALNSFSEPVSEIEAYGYRFSVPWERFSRQDAISSSIIWWANEDASISVYCLMPKTDVLGAILRESAGGDDDVSRMVEEELDLSEVVNTNYYLMSKMLHTTSRDLSVFDPISEVMTAALFVVPKAMGSYGGSSTVYSLEGGPLKGFQMGNPLDHRFVNFSLFDRFDREIHLIVGIEPTVDVTQDDINTILMTFSSEL